MLCSFESRQTPQFGVPLRRYASWPCACTLVAGLQFSNADTQSIGQFSGAVISQQDLATLNPSNHRSADPGHFAKLRLSETKKNAPIAGKPLRFRNHYKRTHWNLERLSHQSKRVDLRTAIASLPLLHRRSPNSSSSSQICTTDAFTLPSTTKSRGIKPAHHSTAHRGIPFIIARHHAVPPLRSSPCMTLNDAIVVIGKMRCHEK